MTIASSSKYERKWKGTNLAKGCCSDRAGGELGVDGLPGLPQFLLYHSHCHLAVKTGNLHAPVTHLTNACLNQSLQQRMHQPASSATHAPMSVCSNACPNHHSRPMHAGPHNTGLAHGNGEWLNWLAFASMHQWAVHCAPIMCILQKLGRVLVTNVVRARLHIHWCLWRLACLLCGQTACTSVYD